MINCKGKCESLFPPISSFVILFFLSTIKPMSRNLGQPVNQKRLTNIVIVRLKKNGMRFEVAAYPNKVEEYRKKMCTSPRTCLFLTLFFPLCCPLTILYSLLLHFSVNCSYLCLLQCHNSQSFH